MKPDKPRIWLNLQSPTFEQDIQALGGTIISMHPDDMILDPNQLGKG